MSSKSPMRSCEDVDETSLSYAEIKALCAGNPLIAEKMALDNDVAKLRMLKSEYQNQRYRLEDSLLKRYPERITSVTERIAGIEKDIAMYNKIKEKSVDVQKSLTSTAISAKFPGMIINDVTYNEKEPAAKALLESCKGIKDKNTEMPLGEFMGFKTSLKYEPFGQQINLLLRGAITYQVELGTDALGNITRINNNLDKLPERLESAKLQLENINKQVEAAKFEICKPFEQETELQEKEARLALLNSDLNIDGDGGFDVMNDTENLDAEDFVEQAGQDLSEPPGQDLNELRVNYTRADNLDNDAESESSDDVTDEDCVENDKTTGRFQQLTSQKIKPSIIEGIRNFDSNKYNSVFDSTKQSEHAI